MHGINLKFDKKDFFVNKECIKLSIISQNSSFVLSLLKKYLIKIPNFKNVYIDVDNNCREFLFEYTVLDDNSAISKIENHLNTKLEFKKVSITLNYDNMKIDDVYNKLLPKNVTHPSSIQIIGHIGHLNLKEDQLPYKYIIGQIILDKIPSIKTVVNKIKSIDNRFRNAEIELLAGMDDYNVLVKEQLCRFKFNYKKVYWNSKLHDEHTRIVNALPHGSILMDVFAGVGPFTIPAAYHKKCIVYANDANPSSIEYLNLNCKLNKVSDMVNVECMDASDFIGYTIKKIYNKIDPLNNGLTIVMNLPALALDFLYNIDEAYRNLSCKDNIVVLPKINCYCFIKTHGNTNNNPSTLPHTNSATVYNSTNEVETKIKTQFKYLSIKDIHFFNVRKVSPNKSMFCVQIDFALDPLKNIINTSDHKSKQTNILVDDFVNKKTKF